MTPWLRGYVRAYESLGGSNARSQAIVHRRGIIQPFSGVSSWPNCWARADNSDRHHPVVNHQRSIAPLDRSADVYSRLEFVQSLTIPVTTTFALFDAWRLGDWDAIRSALFSAVTHPDPTPEAAPVKEESPPATGRTGWPGREGECEEEAGVSSNPAECSCQAIDSYWDR
jgi:hypothetical protein